LIWTALNAARTVNLPAVMMAMVTIYPMLWPCEKVKGFDSFEIAFPLAAKKGS